MNSQNKYFSTLSIGEKFWADSLLIPWNKNYQLSTLRVNIIKVSNKSSSDFLRKKAPKIHVYI